ncbi:MULTISPECIES: M23 family metallopeptidase [Streptomyces]|uniref:M23 family peptidase n=1 Tax=Streptomyces tsukubensis (strain DSM 42081 / NBRC 108919 / NRRL 18488 / 9993) TaxID=1114943 RepID=I2N3Q6_STRT9|nr:MULTISPECIES: M23 family metallopeptidase [Streptomyces]AZK95737.1 peptidase [Streptomyces tsukubensis]EIF91653.1 M23 family peptidase [Streptomyces tsukubensis NRRL18488]MYS66054.1 peptidoglycan DD-metalloendopeptidase family protein [Streptomyces sp. SID5473]QKM68235.1 M23 family peptidase [Streptomyces tsukubensis NRRL18488]TAI43055.1 M23 family metallopeptidase [Streptomyces tsukubensis]
MTRVTSRFPRPAFLRTRAGILVAGLGATAVLGTGAAFAVEATGSPSAAPVKAAEKAPAAAKAAAPVKAVPQAAPKAAPQAAPKAAAPAWVKPLGSYTLSATYGKAGGMWASNHSGQDFAVPTGTPVVSIGAGTVVKAGPNGAGDGPAYGNAVVVKHNNGMYSQYAHLSTVNVSAGQTVKAGQLIAKSGNTGNSSGPHLHMEIRTTPNYGSSVDPVGFLRSVGVSI